MMPLTETYKPKLENVRLASVVVSEGELSIPQIVAQLQRLVPSEQFVWDVEQVGRNVFKVQFPHRNDLERLRVFGACKVPNTPCELTIDSWAHVPQPMETLPKIWVRVKGIPWIHRSDFVALWTVGDLFGMTLKIDMAYTRKHGVLRILIGCLNWSKIPKHFPMFIKDGFYNLTFIVDGEDTGDIDDMDLDDPKGDDDDDEDLGEDFREALAKEEEAKENKPADSQGSGSEPALPQQEGGSNNDNLAGGKNVTGVIFFSFGSQGNQGG